MGPEEVPRVKERQLPGEQSQVARRAIEVLERGMKHKAHLTIFACHLLLLKQHSFFILQPSIDLSNSSSRKILCSQIQLARVIIRKLFTNLRRRRCKRKEK